MGKGMDRLASLWFGVGGLVFLAIGYMQQFTPETEVPGLLRAILGAVLLHHGWSSSPKD